MSQMFSDLDFSRGSEARFRTPITDIIVHFNLRHNGNGSTSKERIPRLLACRVPAMKKCHQNKLGTVGPPRKALARN